MIAVPLDKFILEILNNGSIRVHIKNECIIMPLIQIIDTHINNHKHLKSIIKRFDTESVETLFVDSEVLAIVAAMPPTTIQPGYAWDLQKDIDEFNHRQIVAGYNALHHTSITYEDINAK